MKAIQLPVLFMQPLWGATAAGLDSADAGKITLEIIVMCVYVSTELHFLKLGFKNFDRSQIFDLVRIILVRMEPRV